MTERPIRRIRLIDPRFQLRMVLTFLAVQLLVTLLFAFAIYTFFDSELQAELASAHARVMNLNSQLLPIVVVLSTGTFLLSFLLITAFVVRLSHRMAGPLFRFRLVLESISHRVLPTHRAIRPEDQLQEVANALAEAVRVIELDFQVWRGTCASAREALERGDPAAAAKELEALEQGLHAWGRER